MPPLKTLMIQYPAELNFDPSTNNFFWSVFFLFMDHVVEGGRAKLACFPLINLVNRLKECLSCYLIPVLSEERLP